MAHFRSRRSISIRQKTSGFFCSVWSKWLFKTQQWFLHLCSNLHHLTHRTTQSKLGAINEDGYHIPLHCKCLKIVYKNCIKVVSSDEQQGWIKNSFLKLLCLWNFCTLKNHPEGQIGPFGRPVLAHGSSLWHPVLTLLSQRDHQQSHLQIRMDQLFFLCIKPGEFDFQIAFPTCPLELFPSTYVFAEMQYEAQTTKTLQSRQWLFDS